MKNRNKKKLLVAGGAFLLLGVSYLLCRYVFFDLHGMKQWPNALAALCLAVLIVSALAGKARLAAATALGYICGFGAGLLLHSDGVDQGGGAVNDLWEIWTAVLLIFIAAGIAAEAAAAIKEKGRRK